MTQMYVQMLVLVAVLGVEELDHAKMEAWLKKDDEHAIKKAFIHNEEAALPFVDEYLEGGLAKLEEGKDKASTRDQYAKGVAFAKMADEALSNGVLSKYASAYVGWTPEQQKQFREAQAEYRKGRELMSKPAEALPHLEQSLKLCSPLGDLWGQAMCFSKLTTTLHALNRHDDAVGAASKAIILNESLHQLSAQAQDLITRAHCFAALDKKTEAEKDLQAASVVINKVQDEKRKAELRNRCAEIYQMIGRKDMADAMRDAAARIEKDSSATSQPKD